MLFAGDWHGDEDWAATVIGRAADMGAAWVVQVGDFGFGFFRLGDDPAVPGDWAPRCPFARRVSALAAESGVPVVFIDGNHDNPVLLARLAERQRRAQVAAAVERTGPRLVVHGHWHLRYTAEHPNARRREGGSGPDRAPAVTRIEGLASNLQHDDRALLALDLAVTPPP